MSLAHREDQSQEQECGWPQTRGILSVRSPRPVRLSEARAPAALAEARRCTAEQRQERELTAQAHGDGEGKQKQAQGRCFLSCLSEP